ncbi:hypothetical protein LTR95_007774 [Oleoguttula sp. CCFEE 5521]
MAHRCICGESFPSPTSLEVHGFAKGHTYLCCGALFRLAETLNAHRRSKSHVRGHHAVENLSLRANKDCGLCNKHGFTDSRLEQHMLTKHNPRITCPHCPSKAFNYDFALAQHIKATHRPCPQCSHTFRNSAILFGHQKTSNHLFCLEHDMDFSSPAALAQHLREDAHISSFECTTCDRAFKTEIALNDRLDSVGHACVIEAAARQIADSQNASTDVARREENKLFCESLNRRFKTLRALQQHRNSLKHKPLSEMRCTLSDQCTGVFTSPSALLFHLESNTCKSGMTREKLNSVVAKYDVNRHITGTSGTGSLAAVEHDRSLSATALLRSTPTLDSLSISDASGVVLTPTNTSVGHSIAPTNGTYAGSTLSASSGVMLTPSASIAGSEAYGEESGMPGPPIRHHAAREWSFLNGVPPVVTQTSSSLSMAISPNAAATSQYHSSRAEHFHCPTALLGLSGSTKQMRSFKTLSGLAQHLEAGACKGGTGILGMIAEMVEREIEKAGGGKVKLLNIVSVERIWRVAEWVKTSGLNSEYLNIQKIRTPLDISLTWLRLSFPGSDKMCLDRHVERRHKVPKAFKGSKSRRRPVKKCDRLCLVDDSQVQQAEDLEVCTELLESALGNLALAGIVPRLRICGYDTRFSPYDISFGSSAVKRQPKSLGNPLHDGRIHISSGEVHMTLLAIAQSRFPIVELDLAGSP